MQKWFWTRREKWWEMSICASFMAPQWLQLTWDRPLKSLWWNRRVLKLVCSNISNLFTSKCRKSGDCWYNRAFIVHGKAVSETKREPWSHCRHPIIMGRQVVDYDNGITQLLSTNDGPSVWPTVTHLHFEIPDPEVLLAPVILDQMEEKVQSDPFDNLLEGLCQRQDFPPHCQAALRWSGVNRPTLGRLWAPTGSHWGLDSRGGIF